MIIDGKAIAKQIEEETKTRLEQLKKNRGRAPRLALVCMGDGDAKLYVKNIEKACERTGIDVVSHVFPEDAGEREVINYLKVLNADKGTDAIVVHRPLPVPDKKIIASIDPRKDAYGYYVLKRACTPQAVIEILEKGGYPIEGKHVVIINRNKYHGIPLAHLLLKKNATVTVCHTKTYDLNWHTGQADILITAAGEPGLIKGEMIKKGAVVVDVGMTRVNGQWAGDTDFNTVREKAEAITPVPGGVGPVASAIILRNVADIFAKA